MHSVDGRRFIGPFALRPVGSFNLTGFLVDPDLPEELLAPGWLRSRAIALFEEYHEELSEKAREYFDSVF